MARDRKDVGGSWLVFDVILTHKARPTTEHDVRVRPAPAEAGDADQRVLSQRHGVVDHCEVKRVKIDLRVQDLRVKAGWHDPML